MQELKRGTKLSPEEEALMLELHRAGKTDRDIGEAVGRGRKTVAVWRKRNGLDINPSDYHTRVGPLTFNPEDALAHYQRGLTDGQIARLLGVFPASIRQWRIRQGLTSHGKPHEKKDSTPPPEPGKSARMAFSDDEIMGLWRRAENRMVQVKILAELNACTKADMLDKLESLGVDVAVYRLAKPQAKLDPERALQLYRKGYNDVQIARALGVKRKTVLHWRNKSGLAPHFLKIGGAK